MKRSVLVMLMMGAAAMAVLPGCRGERSDAPPRQFMPSLDDQQRWRPQGETDFYADGRQARQPVTGTVPFGFSSSAADASRPDFLREDDGLYRGLDGEGGYLERTPVAALLGSDVTAQGVSDLISRGQERYDIYCSACHGQTGAGDGVVGKRWSYPLPSYHGEQYYPGGEKGADGYLFHTIRNGVPNAPGLLPTMKMQSYAERVSERDAWAIVLYIRSLQRAQQGSLGDIPEDQRDALMQTRGAVSAQPASAGQGGDS